MEPACSLQPKCPRCSSAVWSSLPTSLGHGYTGNLVKLAMDIYRVKTRQCNTTQHKTKPLQFCAIKNHHLCSCPYSSQATGEGWKAEKAEKAHLASRLRKTCFQGCSGQRPHLTHLSHPGFCNQGPEFRVVLSIGPEVSRDVIQLFSPVA